MVDAERDRWFTLVALTCVVLVVLVMAVEILSDALSQALSAQYMYLSLKNKEE
jgi:ABC-type dipeptide/oligopeptide/nickel transport system permease subunit